MISQKLSPATPGNCIEITDENFLYTYCTARDRSQVDKKDIGSLEETAYEFIGKFNSDWLTVPMYRHISKNVTISTVYDDKIEKQLLLTGPPIHEQNVSGIFFIDR